VAARIGPAGQDEFTLAADQCADGTLDWYSFDRNVEVSMGTTELELGEVETRTVVPAPVTLPGMPSHRFWEFEDAVIDLGALRPGATDLVSLLMVETVNGFGNDWFVIPLDLPVGSLSRSRSLVVTDTFGFSQLVLPSGHPDLGGPPTGRHAWCMFQLADQPSATSSEGADEPNAFFLPATVVLPQEGPVLEEVMLLRDELANLAWAVERRLESPLERGSTSRRTTSRPRPCRRRRTQRCRSTSLRPVFQTTGSRCCQSPSATPARSVWPAPPIST
jgi:hypothetical protein